jgi:hypothetical protein
MIVGNEMERLDEPFPSRGGYRLDCVICLDGRALQVLLLGTIGMQVMRQCLSVDFVIIVAFGGGLMVSGKVGQENFIRESQVKFNVWST